MKEYTAIYREKGNINGEEFETSVTANNIVEAKRYVKEDLESQYTIISVKLANPQIG
jgi:hypothetical protein